MNVDSGKVQSFEELGKLFENGKEKKEDWEELPDDITPEETASLQSPAMNRHDRRAAIKMMRLARKAKK